MSLIERLLNKSQAEDNKTEQSSGGESGLADTTPEPASVATEPLPEYGAEDADYQQMLREMEAIHGIIGDDADEDAPDEQGIRVDMTLSQVLDLLPASCRSADTSGVNLDETVKVSVVNPYDQLATGKVAVDLLALVKNVPPGLLSAEVDQHFGDSVQIPLAKVVTAVSPEELQQRTLKAEREPGVYDMPNLFDRSAGTPVDEAAPPEPPSAPAAPAIPVAEEPVGAPGEEPLDALNKESEEETPVGTEEAEPTAPLQPAEVEEQSPALAAAPQQPVIRTREPMEPPAAATPEPVAAPPAPEPAAPPEPQAPESSAPEPEPVIHEAAPAPEPSGKPSVPAQPVAVEPSVPVAATAATAPPVMVGTVDINRACVDELLAALPGLSKAIAARVVEHRPYNTPYHLGRVPGIGKTLFRKLTGQHLPGRGVDLDAIEKVLTGPDGKLPSFEEVARRVADLSGMAGCIFSHTDGYLLAAAWRRGKGQTIGAIAPQIFKHVGKYFDLLQMSPPDSITLYVDPRPVFITRQGDVFMIVVMARSRATARRLEFLEVLGAELVRRWKKKPGETS